MDQMAIYRITEKIGNGFNLENRQVCRKLSNLNSPNIVPLLYAYAIGIGRRQI